MFFYRILLLTLLIAASLSAKPYKGAELRTLQTLRYGRFEVRMQSGAGSGMLSSFFTFNDQGSLPAEWNEIDIEIMGRYSDQVQFNSITYYESHHEHSVVLPFNPHQNFHDYGFEWTPDYIAWLVDGYEVYRQTGAHIQDMNFFQKLMMNIWQPTYVDWAGTFDPSILPVYAYYDKVRYSYYDPTKEEKFVQLWEDNFDSWNTARWGKATHTWDGNNVDFITNNCVFQDGYMILCLTDATNIGYNGGTVQDVDNVPPYIVWARSYGEEAVIYFSEPLDPTEAGNPSHFIIAGSQVHSAALHADQRTVTLTCDLLQPDVQYNLIVNGILDVAGNNSGVKFKIVENGLRAPFTINVAGDELANALAGQEWDYSKNYGQVGGGNVSNGTLTITGTDEPELYQSEARDLTFYELRLPDGQYDVTLKFAETQYSASGQRVFDVYAEGVKVITSLDIFSQVGADAALEITIPAVTVDDGVLSLYFKDNVAAPVLSGVSVEKQVSGIQDRETVPQEFGLLIYPNPFNDHTRVRFSLPTAADVEITVYDVMGREVHRVSRENYTAGSHSRIISAAGLGSGVYFVQVTVDGQPRTTRKVVLLR